MRPVARRLPAACVLLLVACTVPEPGSEVRLPSLLVSDRGGALRIYEEIAGGAARPVGGTEGGGAFSDTMPARLPDGGVVFVSDRDGHPEIYLAPVVGEVRRLTSDPPESPMDDSSPAPLGSDRIVFARGAPGAPKGAPRDLYTLRLPDGQPRRLTHHPADDDEPWGSEDGRAVVFVSDRSGEARIYQIPDADAADPEAEAICLSEAASAPQPPGGGVRHVDRGPVLLHDGSVVFSRSTHGAPPQIYVMDRDGARSGLRQITDPVVLPFGAAEPVLVDDSTLLLVAGPVKDRAGKREGGRFLVYKISLGGFNLARITRDKAPYSDYTRHLTGR